MTNRAELLDALTARLREQSDALKHMPAAWQLMARAVEEIEWLRAELRWVSEQRWSEDADLDDICTRADRALSSAERSDT